MHHMARAFGALITAFLAASLMGAAAQADPLKIRMGWVVPAGDTPFLMFGKQGIARHEGASYTLDAIHFEGTPAMITAIAANEIDIAPLGFSTLALAIQNANLQDLRIIADSYEDGVDGYYSNEFMVLKDGPIKTVEDLRGKVLASNAAGSAVDLPLRMMLRKHHLEDKKDVTIIEVAFPNMRAMLSEHKVDLVSEVHPFVADPALRDIARPLFTQKDAVGRTQMIIQTARSAWLQANHAALVDFLEDSLRAQRWFLDPAHHDEAVKIIAGFMKAPPERFASWLFTKSDDGYRDPDGLPDLDALQANIEIQRELGFLKTDFKVQNYADLSFVREAASRIK